MEYKIQMETANELFEVFVSKLVEYRKGRITHDEGTIKGVPQNPWIFGYIMGFCLSHCLDKKLVDSSDTKGVPDIITIFHLMTYPTGSKDKDQLQEIWNDYQNYQSSGDEYFKEGTLAARLEFNQKELPALKQHCVEQNKLDDSVSGQSGFLDKLERMKNESLSTATLLVNAQGFEAYKMTENTQWLATILLMTPVRFVEDNDLNEEIKQGMVDTFVSHPKWRSLA